jgi:PAS domain S-box-containing protein
MARGHQPIELRQTLEKVKVPSAIVDGQGVITWLNDAAIASFGNLLGRPFTSVVAPQRVALVQRQLARKLQGAPMTDYEVEVFTADSRLRRAEISSVPIQGGDECHAVFGVALPGAPRPDTPFRLTRRQMDVLRLLGEGASTDEIAASLHLSRETVRNHVRHILRELVCTQGSKLSSHTATGCLLTNDSPCAGAPFFAQLRQLAIAANLAAAGISALPAPPSRRQEGRTRSRR